MDHTIGGEIEIPQAPSPKSGQKGHWKFLRVLGILFLGVFVVCLILPTLFEKQIGEKLIAALNDQLTTEVSVASFDLSMLRNFPRASASLEGVIIRDKQDRELLKTESLSFDLGLFSLLGSQAQIHSVGIEKGELFLEVDKEGEGNYTIIKPKEGQSVSDFTLAIQEAQLKNINITYLDLRGPQKVDFHLLQAEVEGNFSAKQFDLELAGKTICEGLNLEGHKYLVNKQADIQGTVSINLPEKKYTFKETQIDLAGNPLKVGGTIQNKDEATHFDLKFFSKKGNLNSIVGFLPLQYTERLSDIRNQGDVDLVGQIKGPLSSNKNPSIDIRFGLKNGSVKSKSLNQSIKNVALQGQFTNGAKRQNSTSSISIEKFKGRFQGQSLAASFLLENFDLPRLDLKLNGQIPLKDLQGFLDLTGVSESKGLVKMSNLKINGLIRDLVNPELAHRVKMEGDISLKDVAFQVNEKPIEFQEGTLSLESNKVSLDELHFIGANSDILFSGHCYNLLPLFFANEEQRKEIKVRFNSELNAKEMDFKELVNLFSKSTEAVVSQNDESGNQFLTEVLQGTFKANVNKFSYGDIKGRDFEGFFEIDNNELAIDGSAWGMDGTWILDGTVFFEEEIHADARLACRSIDLPELFDQTNNFGQKVIRSDHLKGRLLANLKIDAYWDHAGNFLLDDLHVLGDVGIANGQLRDFEMLYEFSDFIKMKDLRHVKFTTMRNWMEVKKSKIYIPSMFVQSNALNLELCGTHSFENKIDYSIQVNAGQVLMNKFKRYNPNMDPVKKENGLFKLNYRVNGTVDDYRVKNDARYVKKRLEQSSVKKRRIKNTLLVEFGELNIPDGTWADWDYPNPALMRPGSIPSEDIDEEPIAALPEQTEVSTDIGPSMDTKEDKSFRLDHVLKKDKPALPTNYNPERETEFMDFEIEGKNKKPEKQGGGG